MRWMNNFNLIFNIGHNNQNMNNSENEKVPAASASQDPKTPAVGDKPSSPDNASSGEADKQKNASAKTVEAGTAKTK